MRLQLSTYEKSYRTKKAESLARLYPRLCERIGLGPLEDLVVQYLKMFPDDEKSAALFGRNFTHFLKRKAPYKDEPFLLELSRFEWTTIQAREKMKLFSSLFNVVAKNPNLTTKGGGEKPKSKDLFYFALKMKDGKVEWNKLSSIEFRLLNWLETEECRDKIKHRTRLLGVGEGPLFQLLKSLSDRHLIEHSTFLRLTQTLLAQEI
jgi:hypothetical protein